MMILKRTILTLELANHCNIALSNETLLLLHTLGHFVCILPHTNVYKII